MRPRVPLLLLGLLLAPRLLSAEPTSITIAGDRVNVRDQAGVEGKKLFQVNTGDKAEVLERSAYIETVDKYTDYWYKIRLNEQEGWVFGLYTSQKLSKRTEKTEMTFNVIEMGDYYHVVFAVPEGFEGWKNFSAPGTIDFGYGESENQLSGYALAKETDTGAGDMTNGQYKNKRFEVEWTVKMLETWKGDGDMSTVKRQVPVIVSLKLLE